jgi:hypothetical protein
MYVLNIRKYLAELMGVQKLTDEDIRRELDELKLDNKVEDLTRNGHIAADPAVQLLARKALNGTAGVEELEQLLRSTKPAPAAAIIIKPPVGPVEGDAVEAAIQARMADANEPYHVAAVAVTRGSSIATTQSSPMGAEGGTS